MKLSLLQTLIEKRDRLTAAIEVLEEHTGGARHATTARHVRAALAARNGGAEDDAPSAKRTKQTRPWVAGNSPFRGANRKIIAVPIPAGMSLKGMEFEKAVALAIEAVKEPIPTPELTLLLESAGLKFPKLRMPRRRFVGMIASRLVNKNQITKTPDGWTARR